METLKTGKDIIEYKVAMAIVISPPVLGAGRLKQFRIHWNKCKHLPPSKVIGINKNHLNFSDCECSVLPQDRSWWVETKLKNGWERNAIHFQEKYAKYFNLGYWKEGTQKYIVPMRDGTAFSHLIDNKAQSGAIGCALSHILAWQHIVKNLPQDQVAMVIEDDVFLNPERSFTSIRMPSEADCLHFINAPQSTHYIPYSKDFLRVESAVTTQLYFVTQQGAQKLLNEALPMPINCEIDMQLFYEMSQKTQTTYKVFTEKSQATKRFDIFVEASRRSLIRGWRAPSIAGLKHRIRKFLNQSK